MQSRATWILVGVALGAVVFAVGAGLAIGVGTWLWAVGAANQETNSEATSWFVVGALIGVVYFAPLGAVFGLVQRLAKPERNSTRFVPLIGLGLGVVAAASGGASSLDIGVGVIAWPFIGLAGGLAIRLLFQKLVAASVPVTPPAPSRFRPRGNHANWDR